MFSVPVFATDHRRFGADEEQLFAWLRDDRTNSAQAVGAPSDDGGGDTTTASGTLRHGVASLPIPHTQSHSMKKTTPSETDQKAEASAADDDAAAGAIAGSAQAARLPASQRVGRTSSANGTMQSSAFICERQLNTSSTRKQSVPPAPAPAPLVSLYGLLRAPLGAGVEVVSNCVDPVAGGTWWLGFYDGQTGLLPRAELKHADSVPPQYAHELWAFLGRLGLHNFFGSVREVLGAESLEDLQQYLCEEHLNLLDMKPLQKIKLLDAVRSLTRAVAPPQHVVHRQQQGRSRAHRPQRAVSPGAATSWGHSPNDVSTPQQVQEPPLDLDSAARDLLGLSNNDASSSAVQEEPGSTTPTRVSSSFSTDRSHSAPSLAVGQFVFLSNEHFQFSRTAAPQNPQFWLARVCTVGTNGLARLQWFVEAPYCGAGTFQCTSRYFVEPVSSLTPAPPVRFSNHDQLWHLDTPLHLRGKLLAAVPTEVTITARADQCRFEVALQLRCVASRLDSGGAAAVRSTLADCMRATLLDAADELWQMHGLLDTPDKQYKYGIGISTGRVSGSGSGSSGGRAAGDNDGNPLSRLPVVIEVADVDPNVFLGGGDVLFYINFPTGLGSRAAGRAALEANIAVAAGDVVTVENVCQVIQAAVRSNLLPSFEQVGGVVVQKCHDAQVVRLQFLEARDFGLSSEPAAGSDLQQSGESGGGEMVESNGTSAASSPSATLSAGPQPPSPPKPLPALLEGDFVFYANQFFRADVPENPLSNPRFWVGRVLQYFPHLAELQRLSAAQLGQLALSQLQVQAAVKSNADGAVCVLRWMRETESGSALYMPTQTVVLEACARLKRVVGDMRFDGERGVFEYSLKARAKPRAPQPVEDGTVPSSRTVHARGGQLGVGEGGTDADDMKDTLDADTNNETETHATDFQRALLEANLERQFGNAGVKHALPPKLPATRTSNCNENLSLAKDFEHGTATSPDLRAEPTTAAATPVPPRVDVQDDYVAESSEEEPVPPPGPPPRSGLRSAHVLHTGHQSPADNSLEPSPHRSSDSEGAGIEGQNFPKPEADAPNGGDNRKSPDVRADDAEDATELVNTALPCATAVDSVPAGDSKCAAGTDSGSIEFPPPPRESEEILDLRLTPLPPETPNGKQTRPEKPSPRRRLSTEEVAVIERQTTDLIEEVLSAPSSPASATTQAASEASAAVGKTRKLSRRFSKQQLRAIERQTTDLIEDIISAPSTPKTVPAASDIFEDEDREPPTPDSPRAASDASSEDGESKSRALVVEGWLARRISKHGSVSKFKRQFFRLSTVLQDAQFVGVLEYYGHEEANEPVAVYNVTASTSVTLAATEASAGDDVSHRFTLATRHAGMPKSQKLYLEADNENDLQTWLQALQQLIDHLQNESGVGAPSGHRATSQQAALQKSARSSFLIRASGEGDSDDDVPPPPPPPPE